VLGCGGVPSPTNPVALHPPELELMAALPIEAPENFQPSGLWVEEGRLLVVSDKHDATIYELALEAEHAAARPFAHFARPSEAVDMLDLEGLSGDGAGGFWLASEGAFRVASVGVARTEDASGPSGRALWITPSLRAAGEAAGCFQINNAGFEGLARLDAQRLLLAIERQPRGLVEVALGSGGPKVVVQTMAESSYALPHGRPADFSDLSVAEGEVYALMRNGHLVVRLERREGAWVEGQGASYAAAENDPRYIYADATFGLAEGLALTQDRIFIVLDNNGQARASAPADFRPLLFIFRRPPGF